MNSTPGIVHTLTQTQGSVEASAVMQSSRICGWRRHIVLDYLMHMNVEQQSEMHAICSFGLFEEHFAAAPLDFYWHLDHSVCGYS